MGLKPYDANGTARMSWPEGHATVTVLPLSTPKVPYEGQLAQRATRAGEAVALPVAVIEGVMVAVMGGDTEPDSAATVGRGEPT
jgi:hypothetical protein